MKKFSLIAVLLSAGILAACGGANQKAESAVDATKNAAATAVDAGKNGMQCFHMSTIQNEEDDL